MERLIIDGFAALDARLQRIEHRLEGYPMPPGPPGPPRPPIPIVTIDTSVPTEEFKERLAKLKEAMGLFRDLGKALGGG